MTNDETAEIAEAVLRAALEWRWNLGDNVRDVNEWDLMKACDALSYAKRNEGQDD